MDWNRILNPDETEQPLDVLSENGGFCGIFRTVACIGDSLSSGEFESLTSDGKKGYHDCFDYSWGQFMARDCGLKVLNFSRGGMTAKEYWESFAEKNGFWDRDKLCNAYIVALGVNDLCNAKQPIGSVGDAVGETFAGWYGAILDRIRSLQPDAFFFLMSMPREPDGNDGIRARHAELLHEFARKNSHTYVLDFFRYAPEQDEAYRRRFYMSGHLNPAGYLLTARMVESYIDYLVRHNPDDFHQIGFIGTEFSNCKYPK